MQQFCTYGSVRGALGNRRPYRDKSRFEGFTYKTESPKIVLCAVQTLSNRRCSVTCPRSNGFPRTIL